MQLGDIDIKINNLYFPIATVLLASSAMVMCFNNGFLITMDIRVKPEYDDPWSFSDLIRESKKHLKVLDKHLQNV
ncbi:hypothetical protein GCM10010995_10680 [Cysteiniphilum litorale]|uniref:Uncharacterized protein n=1 Tax=Cysteiniphilum litorale TaxID=2056700 RepID=A0A8J2Z3N7_9GAMM|nr:hypothetical protein GCM10010995_10680 [Cysteiniphilum litorale]